MSHPSTSSSAPRSDVVPDDAKSAPAACQNNCLWHGHIRQLFHRQRLAKHGSLRNQSSRVILGTSIPCQKGVNMSRPCKTTTTWSTNCGAGAPRSSIGTGTKDSIISSTVLRPRLPERSLPYPPRRRHFLVGAHVVVVSDACSETGCA